jgi:protein-S-isoprenylcysteine O-methyltransferase Ste14
MNAARGLGYLLATVLIYLGVPLLGWGLADLEGFFSQAARAAYAIVVAAFGVAVGVQGLTSPEGIRGGKEQQGKRVARQHAVRLIMVAMLYGGLFFLAFADRRGILVMTEAPATRWAGLLLTALGCAMVFWSGVSLGAQYSQEVTLQQAHRLITGGAYRFIRHPRYLGVVLLALGLSLLFRSWAGLALFPAVLALLLFRIHDEEKLMHVEFGPEWDAYARRSWRLVPYLY